MFKSVLLFVALLIGVVSCHPGSTRVVNGTAVSQPGSYPYVVSLRRGTSHSCGASIIDKDWVLTAAHCVQNVQPSALTIQYGVLNITAMGTSIVGVQRIISHADYNPRQSYANDIALLQLNASVTFSNVVAPVKLPAQGFRVQPDSMATLVGWGLERTGGSVQTTLQQVDIKVYSDSECNSRHLGRTSVTNICAGIDEGGKGQCSGDSGGPLTWSNDKVQVGIVSWSIKPCTVAGYPGVFTKVSSYINWINENKK